MRTFLVSALLSFGGLAAGTVVPVQDPPAAAAPASQDALTPAEVELIDYYLELRGMEMNQNNEPIHKIWKRYENLILKSLAPEKHPAARVIIAGRC